MDHWMHTVLELYPKPLKNGKFPTEGDPADWIKEGKILYCQGTDDTVIYFMPVWKIVWIKVKKWVTAIYDWVWCLVWRSFLMKRKREKFAQWWDNLCKEDDKVENAWFDEYLTEEADNDCS